MKAICRLYIFLSLVWRFDDYYQIRWDVKSAWDVSGALAEFADLEWMTLNEFEKVGKE